MTNEVDVDKEEMKKCLKDANAYEENMSDDLMVEYYKAIKNSETSLQEESQNSIEIADEAEKSLNESANELLEAINNSESVAPSKRSRYSLKSDDDDSLDAFSQDIFQKPKTKLKQDETNNNNNSIHIDGKLGKVQEKGVILDIKDTPIGFNDMPKSQKIEKDMLKVISHELKFINIQNSKKFLNSNSENRIKMLSNYHRDVAKLEAHYASLSTNMAPIGKPITAIDHDICVNPVISSLKEEVQLSNETTYISRSGRLTKRKVYNDCDDTSLDSFGSSKRTKNDEDWLSKSSIKETTTKSNIKRSKPEEVNANNNDVLDKPLNKPHTKIKRTESPDSSQDPLTLTGFIDQFEELKDSKPTTTKPRTYQRKTPSNVEIIARCPTLFKDTNTPKKGRTGAILNAAKEETEKKKQQEEEISKFTDSLYLDSQALDDDSENIIVDDDDDFEKIRVVPPLPTSRKPIHGRKRGDVDPEALNISTKKANRNSITEEAKSPVSNGVPKRSPLARRARNNNNAERGEPSSSTLSRAKKDVEMMLCPLCSMSFPKKDIEEHAATCGEDMFPQTSQHKRITCEICDCVVPFTTEYEVHVNACIAKRNAGGLV